MRLVNTLSKGEGDEVRLFLVADAVACAKKGQQTPNGFYPELPRWTEAKIGNHVIAVNILPMLRLS